MQKNDAVEIDIRELTFLILKKWYLIAICFVLASGAAFLVSQFYLKPIYKAETTLFLGKEKDKIGGLSFSDLQVNSQLVVDYREILKSTLVAERMQIKLGIDPKIFKSNVDLKMVKDSRIFSISYVDENPKLAADVVNELANEIKQMASDIIEVKNVKVIDTAKVPKFPFKPNKKMNVMIAGLSGILLGLGLVFLMEYVDHTFKKPEEVERLLGLSVIGTVPKFTGGKRGKRKAKNPEELQKEYLKNLITSNNPKAPASEAFRELRTNLHYASVDKKLKVIAVTSPSLGDGKTATTVNLAVTIAQSGKKVLVLDADLRKPKLHYYMGVRNTEGLTNLLTDDKNSSKIKFTQKEDVPNLHIIPSGPIPPNPAEMIGSEKMHQLLEELKNDFDIIIIDTPPVGHVTDAAILSGMVDGTLLVMAFEETRIEFAKRAKKALDGVNAHIIGTVMTKMKTDKASYYYYKYE